MHDFAAPYFVGVDQMAFGSPARYLSIEPWDADAWDAALSCTAERFESAGAYNFLKVNCHSFAAGVLNAALSDAEPSAPPRWSVLGVGARLFLHGRHAGVGGALRCWGGHVALWMLVLASSAREGEWGRALRFAQAVLLANGLFLLWFGVLAACHCDSQYGRLSADESAADESETDSNAPSNAPSPMPARRLDGALRHVDSEQSMPYF